jgi:hypothetical protein
MPTFQLQDNDRERLARRVALQYLRGPDNRRRMTEIAAITLQAQVGMGGLAYLQHALSQGLGREASMAEAERVWDDIHSSHRPEVVVDGEEHLQVLARTYDDATAMVYDRSWCRVTYTRKRLVASDVPVSLVPGDAYDDRGLAGVVAIAVPWTAGPYCGSNSPETAARRPTGTVTRPLSSRTSITTPPHSAQNGFLYFHPGDDPVPSPDCRLSTCSHRSSSLWLGAVQMRYCTPTWPIRRRAAALALADTAGSRQGR